jgi:hypothetical protein
MAATNKCLAQSNKSCTGVPATNKRNFRPHADRCDPHRRAQGGQVMSWQFHWGGQVSADIQAQNQMLFDAMPPEAQARVQIAQALRDLEATRQEFARVKRQQQNGWCRALANLGLITLPDDISELEREFERLEAKLMGDIEKMQAAINAVDEAMATGRNV